MSTDRDQTKRITLPQAFSDAITGRPLGKWVEIAVVVDWFPRLTEEQILANAIACANRERDPYPDPNIISVVAPYVGPR